MVNFCPPFLKLSCIQTHGKTDKQTYVIEDIIPALRKFHLTVVGYNFLIFTQVIQNSAKLNYLWLRTRIHLARLNAPFFSLVTIGLNVYTLYNSMQILNAYYEFWLPPCGDSEWGFILFWLHNDGSFNWLLYIFGRPIAKLKCYRWLQFFHILFSGSHSLLMF